MIKVIGLATIVIALSGCTTTAPSHAQVDGQKINLLCDSEIESAITFNSGMLKSLTTYDSLAGASAGSHFGAQLQVLREVLQRGSPTEKCVVAAAELTRKVLLAERFIDSSRRPVPSVSVDTLKLVNHLDEMKAKLKTISTELDALRRGAV